MICITTILKLETAHRTAETPSQAVTETATFYALNIKLQNSVAHHMKESQEIRTAQNHRSYCANPHHAASHHHGNLTTVTSHLFWSNCYKSQTPLPCAVLSPLNHCPPASAIWRCFAWCSKVSPGRALYKWNIWGPAFFCVPGTWRDAVRGR